MTADEAKQALKDGQKIRHKTWDKFIYLQGININDQRIILIFNKYKDDEWEIVE